MKGPGESEIETDRRALRNKINKLEDRLKIIDKQNSTRRQNRDDKVRIALVGYTNVGKSTLLNLLSKSDVLAEDKLFATLDSTVRKVVIQNVPMLITDTVGFIRKLPHQLVECFKSTLDEIREADLLIHVVDLSHPNFEEQISVVNKTLEEIGAHKTPRLLVFNKIDAYKVTTNEDDEVSETPTVEQLKQTWMSKENAPVIFISASLGENIKELKDFLLKTALKLKPVKVGNQ